MITSGFSAAKWSIISAPFFSHSASSVPITCLLNWLLAPFGRPGPSIPVRNLTRYSDLVRTGLSVGLMAISSGHICTAYILLVIMTISHHE